MSDEPRLIRVIEPFTGLALYEGYSGAHTRKQADGAEPNGTRMSKVRSEPGDTHPVGCICTVLGSIGNLEIGVGYFVEWDLHPGFASFVISKKVAKV